MKAWRRAGAVLAVLVTLVGARAVFGQAQRKAAVADTLPSRLSDEQFWRLITDFSEPNGSFRSENLVSNEHTFQYVIPALKKAVPPGGVYMGVAPDQNFTYIVATQPKMAFIVDIRRGNLLQLMMYKALVELSVDRAEFVSRLFSKKRPLGLGPASRVAEIFVAYDKVPRSDEMYKQNVKAIRDHLLVRHGFPLSPDDVANLEAICFAFFWDGPNIRYSTTPTGFGGGRGSNATFPTYEDLMMQTDWEGVARGYLANEENFRYLKNLEERNLLVPIVGNFAGAKAIRAIGNYIREHNSTVSAFYVSNVEQYLFQDGIWSDFARNVATLPLDGTSTFIRSVSNRNGYSGPYLWIDGRASALDPMRAFVKDFQAGRVRTYQDVNARSK